MAGRNASLRKLGRTGIEVSPIAMGCWAIVGDQNWGPQKEEDAIAAMRAAVDCGINFFDSAEGYGAGHSEELMAKALSDVRDRIVIGTKIGPSHVNSWEALEKACEAALRRLKTDVIDVYHLHWPSRTAPMSDVVERFLRLQRTGKIRSFGVSNFGKGDLGELFEHGRCEVNQLPYSLLWRAIEAEIVPICVANDVSVTCYSPLAQGLLTGKFKTAADVPDGRARTRHFSCSRAQVRHGEAGCEEATFATIRAIGEIAAEIGRPMGEVALAWLMQQPGVGSVLVGARNPEQVKQNARAMELVLAPDMIDRLKAATDGLKAAFGSNPDMWQGESRYR